jgi:hypothetical protein
VILYVTCSRALTFENLCQAPRPCVVYSCQLHVPLALEGTDRFVCVCLCVCVLCVCVCLYIYIYIYTQYV